MKNRKQPFGYRVEMGAIVLHPQEATLVEYIFQQYLSGASYKQLVTVLREQSIPYDEGKLSGSAGYSPHMNRCLNWTQPYFKLP